MRYFNAPLWWAAVFTVLLARPLLLAAQTVDGQTKSVGSSASSQHVDPARGLSVDQLVQLAMTRNAELLGVRQGTLEAQGLLRHAGLRANPVLETEFATGRPTGSAGEREWSVGYSHIFELGGKRARRVDVASAGLNLARLEVSNRERTLRAELQERYIDAMAAIRNLEAVTQLLDLTRQSFAVTERRVSAGESARVEQMVLQAEVGRLEAEHLLLASEVQQELSRLRVIAGMPAGESLALQPDGDRPAAAWSLEEALQRGAAARPDLAAARQEEVRTAAEVRLAHAERVPDLAALARYTDAQSTYDAFGLSASGALTPLADRDRVFTTGISVTLPLFSRNQGLIDAARARERAAALRREFLTGSVEAEIRAAYERYLATRRAVEVFRNSVIQAAQQSVTVLRASYDAGEVRLFDVLTEQRRLIDTQKAYTDAIRQEALARVALERAVGVPFQ